MASISNSKFCEIHDAVDFSDVSAEAFADSLCVWMAYDSRERPCLIASIKAALTAYRSSGHHKAAAAVEHMPTNVAKRVARGVETLALIQEVAALRAAEREVSPAEAQITGLDNLKVPSDLEVLEVYLAKWDGWCRPRPAFGSVRIYTDLDGDIFLERWRGQKIGYELVARKPFYV